MNGTAAVPTEHVVGKSHPAQSMDGATEYESRTARLELNGASTPTGIASHSSPRRQHHRNYSDTNDSGYPLYDGQTANLIGPSNSIPEHLGSARSSRQQFYAEETDGASMSRSYDVTPNQSDRSRKRDVPRHPNVELLTYKQHPETVGQGDEEGGGGSFQERFVGETDMTLSQQETASDIDAKIVEMMRKRKISAGTSRAPKTTVLPTKESMREVMNLAPERKKKSSRTETKRLERNSVHGVPWGTENKPVELEREDSAKRERDANLQKRLDKRRQKQAKQDAAIKLVGFKRVGDFCSSPPIPEEGEMTNQGMRQSSSLNFMSSNAVAVPSNSSRSAEGGKGSISASSSFEFRSGFSPTHTRVSPSRGVIEFGSPRGATSGGPTVVKQKLAATASVPVTSSFQNVDDRTVYRPNLAETHLSDVAVFGKHFDPSQLTQERMEMNVGDLSSVGLNQPSPLKKKGQRTLGETGRGHEFASGSLKLERGSHWTPRSQSESVSPKRQGVGGGDSWEVTAHAARHSSVLSTPSRYRMGRVLHNFRDDVFTEELPQGSMPDIFRPSKSLSPSHRKTQGVKEGTPDSGTSDEEKPKKKRSIGYSLGRKLSSSMRELFSKEKRNPTSGTTWHFEGGGSGLYPAPSEPQLSVLTEQERREILEETEVLPRTRSTEVVLSPQQPQQTSTPATTTGSSGGNPLAHLFIPPKGLSIGKEGTDTKHNMPSGFYEERSVDAGPLSPRKSVGSDNAEYDTASDSEEGYVKSSVNIITSSPPPEAALIEAGYSTGREKGQDRGTSPQTGLTTPQTGPQTGLPTIVERSPPVDVFAGYEMPHSESAPIMKTLEGIVDKKSGKKGKTSKSSSTSESVRETASKKEKKPLFRFTKSRTVVQRGTQSPRPASPLSLPGSKSVSPRSSGRLSPSQRPGTKSSAPGGTGSKSANNNSAESTRRGSKTSLGGGEPSSSPGGGFRGGQISSFSPGGRGSPRGSFRGGAVSPLRSSIRSTTSATGIPGGLNSGKGRGAGSPTPKGSTRSPRGSIQGGSPRSSGRGAKNSPPSGGVSPGLKTPSPRASTQLNASKRLSPVVTRRQPPSASATPGSKGKRRLSEPVVTPPLSVGGSSFSRSPSERHSNVSIGSYKPVRKAPPPPIKVSQQKTPGEAHASLSRTSSKASTSSSTSSPRQRKKGVALSESPLSPRRLSAVLMEKEAAAIASGDGEVFSDKKPKEQDETEKLMISIREKLASLSENTPPDEDLNPLDHQSTFEVPPPPQKTTPTATPFSPTGLEAKVPTYKLTPTGELKIEGEEEEEEKKKEGEKKEVDEVEEEEFTAALTPGSNRRGLRPKTVISALIGGGRGKKKGSVASKDTSGGSFRKGKANTLSAESTTETKTKAAASSSPRAVPKQLAASSSGKPPQKGGVLAGLPPRGPPSVRGNKSGSKIGGGRSQSTIVVPTIKVSETRKSTRKASSAAAVGMATSGGLRSSRGNALGSQASLVRSSIRVSSKLKKNNPMSPEHRKISSLGRQKGGGERPPSRGSMHSLPRNSTAARVSTRRPARVAPVAPGRAPSRKVSTGSNENRKTSVATTNLDTRRTSVLSKSLRKTSVPRSATEESLNRSVATRSMRMPSSRRVSTLGTMPRSSVVSKVAGGNLQASSAAMGVGSGVARKSMRKVSSQTKDVFDAFDKISADAQGKL